MEDIYCHYARLGGRVIAQTVRYWLLNAVLWVQFPVTSYEICGGRSRVGFVCLWVSSVLHSDHCSPLLHAHLSTELLIGLGTGRLQSKNVEFITRPVTETYLKITLQYK